MKVKFIELELADRIMSQVFRGLKRIEEKVELQEADMGKLERLTKVYTMLMSNTRENIKHKLYSHVDASELGDAEELQDAEDQSDED